MTKYITPLKFGCDNMLIANIVILTKNDNKNNYNK